MLLGREIDSKASLCSMKINKYNPIDVLILFFKIFNSFSNARKKSILFI